MKKSAPCAVILLAGGAGTRAFSEQVRRPVLAMPISDSETVLGMWHVQVRNCLRRADFEGIPMIIAGGTHPQSLVHWDSPRVQHLDDPQELRGTGGVLRDLTARFPDDAYVLIASAAALLFEPLETVVGELSSCGTDAALSADESAAPGSIMLLRARCLRTIAPVGFVDFKEQAMPGIAARNSVAVLRRRTLAAASLRTAAAYIAALRRFYAMQSCKDSDDGNEGASAFTEQWKPLFSIVESGAHVSHDARIHDSVVLTGAHVARSATIVRSVICPGARIPPNALIVDQLVGGRNEG